MVHRSLVLKSHVVGLFLMGVSLFLALILFTFNRQDPSFFFSIASLHPIVHHNGGGVIGAYLASGLFFLCGSAALWLIPFFFLLGLETFRWNKQTPDWSRIGGFLVLLVAQGMLCCQIGYDVVSVGLLGGVVGAFGTHLLLVYTDALIAYATALMLSSVGLVLVFRFSWAVQLCRGSCWCNFVASATNCHRDAACNGPFVCGYYSDAERG